MVQQRVFAGLPPSARRAFFALVLLAICLLFAFPVLWLILTSLRPESGVYYVHRGLEFTLGRPLADADVPLYEALGAASLPVADIVVKLVTSPQFLNRRVSGEPERGNKP